MPLIFAESEFTESGIKYADKTGSRYEFPTRYKKLIRAGEQFIYYRGRKKLRGRQLPVYFGAGIVGPVTSEASSDGRLVCQILKYVPFDVPVPFKQGRNEYLEHGGTRKGYFQQGVRSISVGEHAAILNLATGRQFETVGAVGDIGARKRSIDRMVATASQTVEHSNGQIAAKRIKDKNIFMSLETLRAHIEELLDVQHGKCALSGLNLHFDADDADSELLCSLDRIDSDGHYNLGNLQVVCRFLNRWKSNGCDREFRRLLSLLRN